MQATYPAGDRSFVPVPFPPRTHQGATDSLQRRLELVMRFGSHSLACHALQSELKAFYGGTADGCGMVVYKRAMGFHHVLADPVAAPAAAEPLVAGVIAAVPRATFIQIGRGTAEIVARHGYHVNELGTESWLDVQRFSIRGRKLEDLRRYQNCARAAGVVIREMPDSEEQRAVRRGITARWLATKTVRGREMSLLARPCELDLDPGVRAFYAYLGDRAVAFVSFDPIWTEGKLTGYAAAIVRGVPEVPKGTTDYAVLTALEAFRGEGVADLALGLSPFYKVAHPDAALRPSAFMTWLGRASWRLGNSLFEFKNLAFHKSRYRAREEKTYWAFRHTVPLAAVWSTYLACGINPARQVALAAWDAVCGKRRNVVEYEA